MAVTFTEPVPSLNDCLTRVARLCAAYDVGASSDLKDIRAADVISLIGDLHARARELERVRANKENG